MSCLEIDLHSCIFGLRLCTFVPRDWAQDTPDVSGRRSSVAAQHGQPEAAAGRRNEEKRIDLFNFICIYIN